MTDLREKIVGCLRAWTEDTIEDIDAHGEVCCAESAEDLADRILALLPKVPLFQRGDFVLHSGGNTEWRINAEKLDEASIATLASMIAERTGPFSSVQGVPTGGLLLAKALEPFCSNEGPLLIVDDVLTTGVSMEEYRDGSAAIGFVIFDRSGGKRPAWVKALWTLDAKSDDGWILLPERTDPRDRTPPWDGTPVLGAVVGEKAVMRVRWDNHNGEWHISPLGGAVRTPTHWRPLPAPPAAEE